MFIFDVCNWHEFQLINSHSANFHGTKIQNSTVRQRNKKFLSICILLSFVWLEIHKCSLHLIYIGLLIIIFVSNGKLFARTKAKKKKQSMLSCVEIVFFLFFRKTKGFQSVEILKSFKISFLSVLRTFEHKEMVFGLC